LKAQLRAYEDYIRELDKARMDAYKADNKAEVETASKEKNRVQEEMLELQMQYPALMSVQKTIRDNVPANKSWTKILDVKKGQVLEITAAGSWRMHRSDDYKSGPEGHDKDRKWALTNSENEGTLIGKSPKGEIFVVGKKLTYTVREDGELCLGPNTKAIKNGEGQLQVTVVVKVPVTVSPVVQPAVKDLDVVAAKAQHYKMHKMPASRISRNGMRITSAHSIRRVLVLMRQTMWPKWKLCRKKNIGYRKRC